MMPDKFMAILQNPSGHTITLKRNTTISYVKESNYMKNPKLANKKI